MKLSAPIFHLKRRAKILSREAQIPLHQALDQIASGEGFARWSLLAEHASSTTSASQLLSRLAPGELLLLAARPGHGKTMMGLSLLATAVNRGQRGFFFTLECNEKEVLDRFRRVGGDLAAASARFDYDTSDAICADYIIENLTDAPQGSVVVIDYLQLLDQRRENPDLGSQLQRLKSFSKASGVILVLISQIDRSFELSDRPCPDMGDIRLPNPVDLSLFNKACFINDGQVQMETVGR
ncbi:MAG: DNA helicase [Stappiaceae bacterium]